MKIFSKLYAWFQRKLESKYQNLPYWFSLQSVVVYEFTKIESNFPVPFWDYVANCLWLHGMVSICLLRKGKYDWFLREGLLPLIDSFFFYICCNFPAAQNLLQDNKFFILKSVSWFLTSTCPKEISELLLLLSNLISLPFS